LNLLRIIYISRVSGVAKGDMAQILAASRANNARCGVTGALLVSPTGFAQVLEGPADAVGETFERIQCDERHDAVTVLALDPTAERQFADWSMACCEGAEALNEAGVTLAELAANGAASVRPTLDLLERAMRGQGSRTCGKAHLAHLA